MRSTRASAAWAGIALATSFLSVMIIGTQPHSSPTRALATSVAMTSTRDALSNTSLRALKQAEVADVTTPVRAD
jgi:hypothetical protein